MTPFFAFYLFYSFPFFLKMSMTSEKRFIQFCMKDETIGYNSHNLCNNTNEKSVCLYDTLSSKTEKSYLWLLSIQNYCSS